ncbi:hypothetical protein FRC11_000001, partial [Ceratobasidium sp. 423]
MHQGRDFIRVTGSDKVYQVYLNLMDFRTDRESKDGSAGTAGLGSKAATTWCSCETFLIRILVPTEEQM